MTGAAPIDFAPLRRAGAALDDALRFWHEQPADTALKPVLRAAVIQGFEVLYELSIRLLRRVLIERAASAEAVVDLSFNDLLRLGADAGLVADPVRWRRWREMRNATSHTYDEAKAEAVARSAGEFVADAAALRAAFDIDGR